MPKDRDDENQLIAYRLHKNFDMPIVPAVGHRKWMVETPFGFANRCLPLLMANQSGWVLLSQHKVRVTWAGGRSESSTEIEYLEGPKPFPIATNFGNGIISWQIPYLFRTPPGFNLIVRGPPNTPKDGASALEGLVETDWSPAPFTMNWKLTRPNAPVTFEVGEAICMVTPQKRGEMEAMDPVVLEIDSNQALKEEYEVYKNRRLERQQADSINPSDQPDWELHYFRGKFSDSHYSTQHQVKRNLSSFDFEDDE